MSGLEPPEIYRCESLDGNQTEQESAEKHAGGAITQMLLLL